LKGGLRLPGMIKNERGENISVDRVRVGMELTIDFGASESDKWPTWPRFFFKPL
jgi:hypothetical protein